jgi:chromate transporter
MEIFFISLRVGAFSFGGGLAMMPFLQNEYVYKRGWIEEGEIADTYALAQSLPGVIAINAAMLIAHRIVGIKGALAAVFGMLLPSFTLMCLVALFYDSFISSPYVAGAIRAVSAAVAALVLSAAINLRKQLVRDYITLTFALSTVVVCFVFPNLSAVWLIFGGGVLGFALLSVMNRGKRG